MSFYDRHGQTRRELAHAVVFGTLGMISYYRWYLLGGLAVLALPVVVFLAGRWSA